MTLVSSDATRLALTAASKATTLAAQACFDWENGSDPEPVLETAASALRLAEIALEGTTVDEPWTDTLDDPATRRARFAYAGWLLLKAGTDEHGDSSDLRTAADLFAKAADA